MFMHKKKGFTLIEMLVVIFVVGVGLIGALSFFSINIANQAEVKNEVIAAGLAQEGADLVRNIRDYNLLAGNSWYANLCEDNPVKCVSNDSCKAIDYNSLDGASHTCVQNGSANKSVCYDPTTGRYKQCKDTDANQTGFLRSVSLRACDPNKNPMCGGEANLTGQEAYIEVTVTVSWGGNEKKDRKTIAKDMLYKNTF
jgi:prepilin-type N-terminal cleavage/methylation domain-containing protein